jgi:nucleoside 2-deoxyribosyltransferase
MKIYIAGPFFNENERMSLTDMINKVRFGFPDSELFIPMEHEIPGGMEMSNPVWAKKVFDMDVQAIKDSDMVIAMYTGHYSDTGTVWEMGFAKALGKPVIGYIPSWAQTEDVSLMVMNCFDGYMDVNGNITTFSEEILKHYNQK